VAHFFEDAFGIGLAITAIKAVKNMYGARKAQMLDYELSGDGFIVKLWDKKAQEERFIWVSREDVEPFRGIRYAEVWYQVRKWTPYGVPTGRIAPLWSMFLS
jgi:hypothetical protein